MRGFLTASRRSLHAHSSRMHRQRGRIAKVLSGSEWGVNMGEQVPTNKTTSRPRRARKQAQKPSAENECVRHWISFACERCACPELANNIPYTFNVHLKRYAGVAHLIFCGVIFVDSKIVLARRLWPKLNEAGRRNLVVHEACHVIQAHLFGPNTEAHGPYWKWCMRRCDAPPNLCVQEHELHQRP